VIGLRGYGQRDPLNEYKAEAYTLFEAMSQNLREQVTGYLMRIQVMEQPEQGPDLPYMEAHHINPDSGYDYATADAPLQPALAGNGLGMAGAVERNPADPSSWGKVGRNEVCPCGSGKKYKHCHGRFA
jgi:preprotein translocase subunit SecA